MMKRYLLLTCAALFAIALVSADPALAGNGVNQGGNVGQKNDRGNWSGHNKGGGCFCLQRGNGDNSVYPDSGSTKMNNPASTTEGATGPDIP